MAIDLRDIQNTSPQVQVEGDIEFIPSPVEDETNAMIVGPADRGPLFVPTEVRTRQQFEAIFGEPTTYSAYSAGQVLEQTDRVSFTRVAAAEGWDPTALVIFNEGGTDFPHFEAGASDPLAIFIFSDKYKRTQGAVPRKTRILKSTAGQNKTAQDFTMQVFDRDDNLVDQFRLSLNPFSPRYIEKVLPPQIRIYQNFRESQLQVLGEGQDTLISLTSFDEDAVSNPLKFSTFDAPRTPWILSQETAGERHRLFRVWVRSDGEAENRRFKVSITDVGRGESESGWPLFSLRLRNFDDTDFNQTVIEEFDDLSLNPDDERFIGKAIGTEFKGYNESKRVIEQFGAFEGQSLNIRIELSEEIRRSSKKTLPFGFAPYKRTFTNSSQVPVYRGEQNIQNEVIQYINARRVQSGRDTESLEQALHFGVNFQTEQNENFFQGIPLGSQDAGEPFRLDDFLDPTDPTNVDDRKFSVGFQGGSDGQSIYREKFSGADISERNTFGFDFDGRQSDGREAYTRAYELLQEPSAGFNFDLLTTPELDIQTHPQTVRDGATLVESRGDAFYVFDAFTRTDRPEKATRRKFPLNSSRTATYYGWVKPSSSGFDFVPPSAVVPQTYAKSDTISDPWFSPAGPRRGIVPDVEDVAIRIRREQVDDIYGNFTNVIRFSDTDGITLVGNRTYFNNLDSSLSKIDVRRTLVFLISRTRRIAEDYLFEQAIPETAQNLRIDIRNLLSTVQSRNGIRRFQVDVTSSVERQGPTREPNTLEGTISVIPQISAEFITVDFTISEQVEIPS